MKIRNVEETDYIPIISVLNEWWGGRGFEIEPGDCTIDGVPVTKDYDGIGRDCVLFRKRLSD
ncbi:MAG: hypothetical protein ACOY9Y_00690 [Bacillota bacterium]